MYADQFFELFLKIGDIVVCIREQNRHSFRRRHSRKFPSKHQFKIYFTIQKSSE